MSNRIRVLSEELINKIAAGEVVERPGSVVKELVENAIDAAAKRITIEVTAGGKQLVRVVDDGHGMSRDDAILAFERHATSKIAEPKDLHAITTLGFRGEALPSIAAVSRLTLETSEADEIAGTKVIIEGGQIRDVVDVGRNVGTTISVRNLFFNTPARRKFLKSTETEFRHIVQHTTQIAMSHPEVAFRLCHNDREVLGVERKDSRGDRLKDLLGEEFSKALLPISYSVRGLTIDGFIGTPESARTSRIHQLTFVNERYISNRVIHHAVFAGYGTALPRDRYPIFVLFLEIDPSIVDINVHPTKREVRFSNDKMIHDTVSDGVRKALQSEQIVPELTSTKGTSTKARVAAEREATSFPSRVERAVEKYISRQDTAGPKQTALPLSRQKRGPPSEWTGRPARGPVQTEDRAEVSPTIEEGKPVLWQLHERYILAPIKNGLQIIDQHVAHERIIYEDTLKHFGDRKAAAQQLLFPLTLEFTPTEMQVLREIIPLLEQMGFSIREFGRNEVVVEAIPPDLKTWGEGEVLRAMVDDMVKMGSISSGLTEKLATSFACHSAVKSGTKLSVVEMQNLVDQLFATEQPFLCPHGRPVIVKMPLEEFDKLFGR